VDEEQWHEQQQQQHQQEEQSCANNTALTNQPKQTLETWLLLFTRVTPPASLQQSEGFV
jgi:hypothetical protein